MIIILYFKSKQKKVDIFKIFKDEVNNVFDTICLDKSKQEIS